MAQRQVERSLSGVRASSLACGSSVVQLDSTRSTVRPSAARPRPLCVASPWCGRSIRCDNVRRVGALQPRERICRAGLRNAGLRASALEAGMERASTRVIRSSIVWPSMSGLVCHRPTLHAFHAAAGTRGLEGASLCADFTGAQAVRRRGASAPARLPYRFERVVQRSYVVGPWHRAGLSPS